MGGRVGDGQVGYLPDVPYVSVGGGVIDEQGGQGEGKKGCWGARIKIPSSTPTCTPLPYRRPIVKTLLSWY